MAHSNTILHQLLALLPRHQFDEFVLGLAGDRYVKTFSTWNQLSVLLYAQASGKSSLREIRNGLFVQGRRTYHLGLPSDVPKSTLADANAKRDYRIYEQLFYTLLGRCRDHVHASSGWRATSRFRASGSLILRGYAQTSPSA